MSKDSVNAFFQRLAVDLKIPHLAIDEEGIVNLELDGEHIFILQYNEERNTLYAFTELGTLDAKTLPQKAVELLSANLFGTQTGGATLALEPHENIVVFSTVLPVENDNYEKMYDQLERFIHFSEYWQERLWGTLKDEEDTQPEHFDAEHTVQPFDLA